MRNQNIEKKVKKMMNSVKAPGVYYETQGQDALEWIAMAIAVLLAIGFFAARIMGIVSSKTERIDSAFP